MGIAARCSDDVDLSRCQIQQMGVSYLEMEVSAERLPNILEPLSVLLFTQQVCVRYGKAVASVYCLSRPRALIGVHPLQLS